MTATLTNVTSTTFPGGSGGSISFDPMGATLIVATMIWQNTTASPPPGITVGSSAMTLVNTITDATSQAITGLYTLTAPSGISGATTITVSDSTWFGIAAMSIAGFSGTSGLGQVVYHESGSTASPVSTATSSISGISAGSVVCYVGTTMWGSTPSAVTFNGAWTGDTQSVTSGQLGVYPCHLTSPSGGSYSVSMTTVDSGDNFWMLMIGFEVLAGATASPTTGVTITASQFNALGTVSSVQNGTTSFDPGAANLIVAALFTQGSAAATRPSITIGGILMRPVTQPFEADADAFGQIGLYVLSLPSPLVGAQAVVVSSGPTWAGTTLLALYGFSGAATQLGKIAAGNLGIDVGPWVTGDTVSLSNLTTGSLVVYVAGALGSGIPTALSASGTWAADGNNVVATTSSIFGFHDSYLSGTSDSVTISSASNFWSLGLIFEVPVPGYQAPTSLVTVNNSAIFELGGVAGTTVSNNFDAMGGSLMVVFINHGLYTPPDVPSITYAGINLSLVQSLDAVSTADGITSWIAVLAEPPTGTHELVIGGPPLWYGDTTAAVVSLSNLSGKLGASYASINRTATGYTGPLTTTTGSCLIGFAATIYPSADMVASIGWTQLQYAEQSVSTICGLYSAVGGTTSDMMVIAKANVGMSLTVLEFTPVVNLAGSKVASGSTVPALAAAGTLSNLHKLTPSGQEFHIYWESWADQPRVDPMYIKPDDFFLTRIPSFVTAVIISFGFPQCTYTGMTDNIQETTGLGWTHSGQLLYDTIQLLKQRNPNIQIWIAVQQLTNTVDNTPYNPAGWGGMTSTHVANWYKFMQDYGITGFAMDYECVAGPTPDQHCTFDATTQTVSCYTDNEQVRIVKLLRAGLPRPIRLFLDGWSVGAFYEGPYAAAPPIGWNSGFNLAIAKDPDALAALDGIHAMTYDAPAPYAPRTAVEAFKHFFTGVPIYYGLRVGPSDGGGIKRTGAELRSFCNEAIMLGCGGVFMYSMMWDVPILPSVGNGNAPFADYGPNYPNGTICSQIVAEVFNLGTDSNLPGYPHPEMNLNLVNPPSWAQLGMRPLMPF